MRYRILGPLQVGAGGREISVPGPKLRALLAFLLLHRNQVVSSDRIIDALWGTELTGREAATLRVHVSNLRTALEPDRQKGTDGSVLVTHPQGYEFVVEPGCVDAEAFERLTDEGRDLADSDPGGAADRLQDALGLWRGDPLEDLGYLEFAQAEIRRLEDLRQGVTEDLIEIRIAAGEHQSVVGQLEALVQRHPLRERLYRLLMVAQYRSGRQADALRLFQKAARHLGEELGVEPSPQLRRLEEQILLHDPLLEPPRVARARSADAVARRVANPYKGLEMFDEADSERFFGRDEVVAEVLRHIAEGKRLISLVGASGSGKSSVVRAGVIPGLRKGALQRSDEWLFAQMTPGALPFAELEAALLRSRLDAPDSLSDQLRGDDAGLLRAVLRVLPSDSSHMILLVDQFEELFTTVVDEAVRRRFLDNLSTALDDPQGRLTVVVTLRSDFYSKPLEHPGLGERIAEGVVNITPMGPDELEAAAAEPAARHGVEIEPALLASLIAEVSGQIGSLPLFQYTLTELFDRRAGTTITAATSRDIGGVRGALSRRADTLYDELSADERAVAKQLFLRLVTVADSDEWSRRRVPASEIVHLAVDTVSIHAVIESFGSHRLLTRDRDVATGSPTVEVAHEALLTEWPRLKGWIEAARSDLLMHRRLAASTQEWIDAGRDPGYLLSGARLTRLEDWAATTDFALTGLERGHLEASTRSRIDAETAEQARHAREVDLERRSTRRLRLLVTVLAAAAAISTVIGLVAIAQADRARQERTAARSEALGAAALAAIDSDPELGLLLALEAVAIDPRPTAVSALHQAVQTSRLIFSIPASPTSDPRADFDIRPSALSPDGRFLATALRGSVDLWDIDLDTLMWSTTVGSYPETFPQPEIAFSQDGSRVYVPIASNQFDLDGQARIDPGNPMLRGAIAIIDARTGALLEEVATPRCLRLAHPILPLTAMREMFLLESVGCLSTGVPDVDFELFDLASGDTVFLRPGWPSFPLDGTPTVDAGLTLLATPWLGEAEPEVIRIDTGEVVARFDDRGPVATLANDGERILVGGFPLKLRDVRTQELLVQYDGNFSDAWFSHDGSLVFAASDNGPVDVFDSLSGTRLLSLRGHRPGPFGGSATPDETRLVTWEQEVRVWDTRLAGGGEVATFAGGLDGPPSEAPIVDGLHSGGGLILSTIGFAPDFFGVPERVAVLNGTTGDLQFEAGSHAAVISPDGRLVALQGREEKTIRLVEADTGAEVLSMDGVLPVMGDLEFSRDGSVLAAVSHFRTASADRVTVVWDVASGSELLRLEGGWFAVALSPDGETVVQMDWREAIVYTAFDTATGQEIGQFALTAGAEGARDMEFSSDGMLLYVATMGGTIVVIDSETWSVHDRYEIGGGSALSGVALSPQGSLVAATGRDSTLTIWDASTGAMAHSFSIERTPGGITGVAWLDDSTLAVTSHASGDVLVFTLEPQKLVALGAQKLTRGFTAQECTTYDIVPCPDLTDMRARSSRREDIQSGRASCEVSCPNIWSTRLPRHLPISPERPSRISR